MCEFSVSVDDNMVYQGRLRKACAEHGVDFGQTVLFTNDVQVVEDEMRHVYCLDDDEGSGVLFLEGEVFVGHVSSC